MSQPAAGQRKRRPCVALGGRPFQNHSSGGFGQGWPGPVCSTVHSHLVTGQQVLGGLQVRAGLAHEDVPLAGGGPNGLRRGTAVDLPALAARQVEQGQLARGGGRSPPGRRRAAGRGWAAPRPLPLAPRPGGRHPLTQSFMSCSVAAARRTGHLCRVLSGVYRAKECLASLSTGTRAVTSLRNTCRYCAQRAGGRLSPGRTGTACVTPGSTERVLGALACEV